MTNFTKRALTGAVLVSIITLGIIAGELSFLILIVLINLLTLGEFYRLFHSSLLSPRKTGGIVLSISVLISFVLFITGRTDWKVLLVNIPVVFLILVMELFQKSPLPFHNLAFTFLGIFCITVPLCFFIGIAFMPPGSGVYHFQTVLGYFLILWVDDSGAYLIGKNLGRHALFKRISPGKTWEGSLGGLLSALLVAYVSSLIFHTMNTLQWMIMALIIVVTGSFGDLIKSLMKRSLRIKDSGNILPGHGGMLDRFDTLLGSAPFVFSFLVLCGYA